MIRPLKASDALEMLPLFQKYPPGAIDNLGQTFVCEQEEKIVGLIICRLQDEHLLSGGVRRIGRVDTLIVEKELTSAGLVASRLIERAEFYFQDCGCTATETSVEPDNRPLVELLAKRGFYLRSKPVVIYRKEL